jgi:8-oxo-dGTP pyrophosphatase MutT (NUDIX family)
VSFADHIRRCNNYDPAHAMPLLAGGARIGWLRRDNAAVLRRFSDVFAIDDNTAQLLVRDTADATSGAVDAVVEALVVENRVPKWRNETFDVVPRWGDKPLFRLDRGAVPFFGTRAYGVHLNGYLWKDGALHLWIGRRAKNKQVAPGKLDNIVAGGIGNGYGVAATLAKEAEEEAAIPAALIDRAVPVGAVSYCKETKLGIRDDVLFLYDIELPEDFVPENRDGELAGFELLPLTKVLEIVKETEEFKFNVNLVILDFALRHGMLRPDDAETLEVASGLHRPLD